MGWRTPHFPTQKRNIGLAPNCKLLFLGKGTQSNQAKTPKYIPLPRTQSIIRKQLLCSQRKESPTKKYAKGHGPCKPKSTHGQHGSERGLAAITRNTDTSRDATLLPPERAKSDRKRFHAGLCGAARPWQMHAGTSPPDRQPSQLTTAECSQAPDR